MQLKRSILPLIAVLLGVSLPVRATAQLQPYTLFESDPVTPVALSPDGSRLFVVNTPDGKLDILEPRANGTVGIIATVPVGLEPVAVAARSASEVWVVNHLSDSVSVIDASQDPPRVIRTLLVGDEPRGIVFAGPSHSRAFIATAHRGQNLRRPPSDPEDPGDPTDDDEYAAHGRYYAPGEPRADVWVFDATSLGNELGGTPLTIVRLFGDRPRALAASPDGSRVYAAVYRSGNRTVPLSEGVVCNGSGPCNVQGTTYPAGRPDPETNWQGTPSRETGIIVGFNPSNDRWEDELGTDWTSGVRFALPDYDVFEINANAGTPFEVEAGRISGVGTILFNMIVSPSDGRVYVTNTEANNRVRFEGACDYESFIPAKASGDPCSVRGNLHRARITVIDALGNVTPRHLNKHIPYDVSPVPSGVKEKSVATPLQMAVTSDGTTLYVAGFGSNAVAVYDTEQLENDTFVPNTTDLIPIEGPSGLVLDEDRGFLWVSSRRTNSLYSVNLATKTVLRVLVQHNPEPAAIRDGRKFLYDTQLTSSNGEASCASCHLFGDMDDLAWDLGDPDATTPLPNPNPTPPADEFGLIGFLPALQPFDPLKGPMTTQSLRGMARAGPMHWRGDRTGPECDPIPSDPSCANRAFNEFNPAFPGLLGRDEGELDPEAMQSFADFALRLTYPPNPIRPLDNSLSASAAAGKILFGFDPGGNPATGPITDTVAACRGCHHLDRAKGFFGTAGFSTFENETMEFKVAHLRNAYQKVGMFGEPPTSFFPDADPSFMGDQVRGTGFLHDGSVSTVFNFLGAGVFGLDDDQQRDLEAFIMEFDSELAPIVGQQTTVTADTGPEVLARVDLLVERAGAEYYSNAVDGRVKECDLIAKGVVNGQRRGWLFIGSDTFQTDDAQDGVVSKVELLSAAAQPGQAVTFTCVPPGSGRRMGIDRDEDGVLDSDEFGRQLDCSASQIGGSQQRGSSVIFFMVLIGLALHGANRRVSSA